MAFPDLDFTAKDAIVDMTFCVGLLKLSEEGSVVVSELKSNMYSIWSSQHMNFPSLKDKNEFGFPNRFGNQYTSCC